MEYDLFSLQFTVTCSEVETNPFFSSKQTQRNSKFLSKSSISYEKHPVRFPR